MMEADVNLKNLTIGKKIALGFGVVLMLLLFIGLRSNLGIGNIVDNASQVIEGNKLDSELAQREVDHLVWAGQVNNLLNDEEVTTLTVQTDYHKCGFGKWFYGDGRKQAEHLVPSLAPIIKKIEEPHKKLHESAIAIQEVFSPASLNLPAQLQALEVAHLNWAAKVRDALLDKKTTLEGIQTDPTKCGLGKWLQSAEYKNEYTKGKIARVSFRKVLNDFVSNSDIRWQEQEESIEDSVLFTERIMPGVWRRVRLCCEPDKVLGWRVKPFYRILIKSLDEGPFLFSKNLLFGQRPLLFGRISIIGEYYRYAKSRDEMYRCVEEIIATIKRIEPYLDQCILNPLCGSE